MGLTECRLGPCLGEGTRTRAPRACAARHQAVVGKAMVGHLGRESAARYSTHLTTPGWRRLGEDTA